MKNFTSVYDVTHLPTLLDSAMSYKQDPFKDKMLGVGKRVGLIFMNPSMRTRISTQLAARNLGMDTIVFNMDKEGWALEIEEGVVMNGTKVEHIKDAAPVLGSYFDILCVRTFPALINREDDYSEQLLSSLIKYCGVPVVSLESSTLHPLQSFTDLITIREDFKEDRKPKVVLTWAPHVKALPQCVANSFAQWMSASGMVDFVITHPEGYELDERYCNGAVVEYDRGKALADADYVYVKNWSAYSDYGKVLSSDEKWMPCLADVAITNNAKFMHCLPVRRNIELSDDVLDSSNSLVSTQAGNRVWAAQAVLAEILKSM